MSNILVNSDDDHRQFICSRCIIPQRYVLTLMGFLALFNAFAMRATLTIAITKMTYPVNSTDDAATADHSLCPMALNTTSDDDIPLWESHMAAPGLHHRFDWSQELQGIILSSFYWGYLLSHLPGGLLTQKFGGKYVLAVGIFLSGLLSILTPVAVSYGGAHSLIAIRVLMGIAQGPMFPACLALLSSWVPLKERSFIVSLTYGGIMVGTIAGTVISGILLHNIEGWASVFYFFGVTSIIWCFLFIILCHSNPGSHPFISGTEKQYLEKELGHVECDATKLRTPWKLILTSSPVLALIFTQAAHDWGFFVIATDLPKYMNDVLHVAVQDNGFFSSLPHFVELIFSFFIGYLSDWMIANQYLNVTNSRKLFVFLASLFAAVFFIAASYAGCDQTLVVLFFTLSVGSQALTIPGTYVNPLDLSPNYVGPLTALVNGAGSITGILAPYIIGLLTPNALVSQWRMVFWLTFVIYMLAIVVYSIWGSGDIQPWNAVRAPCPSSRPNIDGSSTTNSYIDGEKNKHYFPETYQILVFIAYNSLLLLLFTYV